MDPDTPALVNETRRIKISPFPFVNILFIFNVTKLPVADVDDGQGFVINSQVMFQYGDNNPSTPALVNETRWIKISPFPFVFPFISPPVDQPSNTGYIFKLWQCCNWAEVSKVNESWHMLKRLLPGFVDSNPENTTRVRLLNLLKPF